MYVICFFFPLCKLVLVELNETQDPKWLGVIYQDDNDTKLYNNNNKKESLTFCNNSNIHQCFHFISIPQLRLF